MSFIHTQECWALNHKIKAASAKKQRHSCPSPTQTHHSARSGESVSNGHKKVLSNVKTKSLHSGPLTNALSVFKGIFYLQTSVNTIHPSSSCTCWIDAAKPQSLYNGPQQSPVYEDPTKIHTMSYCSRFWLIPLSHLSDVTNLNLNSSEHRRELNPASISEFYRVVHM